MAGWRLHSAVLGVLGVLALMASVSTATDCSAKLVANCDCEGGANGGFDYWCPNRLEHTVTVSYNARRMTVQCNPEVNVSASDLLAMLKDVNVELDLLVVQFCPLLPTSYANLIASAAKGLKELRLDQNKANGAGFVAGNFEGLATLETLKIQSVRSKLAGVDPDAFRGLSSLKRLYLTSLNISSISPVLLTPLKNLLYLDLMESRLEDIPGALLASQEKLKYFKLAASAIRTLPADIFHNVNKTLESAELKINFSSDSLPESLLSDTRSLKDFTVNGNGLEFISETFFSNTSLEHLTWSLYKCPNGKSCMLAPRAFTRNISSLKSFSFTMAGKGVNVRFPEDMFLGCAQMRNVTLKFTDTTTLPKDLFASNRELRILDLQNNKLTDFPDELLRGLTKLEELKLNFNNLTFLKYSWLSELSSLRLLQLRRNAIAGMDSSPFTSTIKLEELDLSENKISFDDNNQPSWNGLNALKMLKLAKNKNIALTRIPYEWTILGDLRTLDLSNNKIGPDFNAESLHFLQNEIMVYLSNNKIRRVRFGSMDPLPDGGIAAGRNNRVLLGGNPLECDCSALDLLRAVKKQSRVPLRFTLNGTGLKCAGPKELRNRSVVEIGDDDLKCAFPDDEDFASVECPSGCNCSYTPSLSLTTVDCSGAGLTALPKFVPLIPGATHVTFNLSDNRIPTLKNAASAVKGYYNITELDLSNNTIREISLQDLPPNLSGIALDGNRLATISADILKKPELKWLRLGGNQYECGCHSKPLYDFLRTDSAKVRDTENITLNCEDKSTVLEDMDLGDFCVSTSTIVLRFVLPLIIFLVILLAMVVVVLYYKTPICIWLYSKPKLRWIFVIIFPESEVLEYDVFVSYSDHDKDFVERTLLQELERGNNIRYRCLVHARDFEPGRNIYEQIDEAVNRSRRTLIVLSKNFVTSDWYRHEFNLAHGANRAVVVVLGELPAEDEMGSLMSNYIKTNTYLPYGGEDDKWFWDKLRYALPHKNEVPFRLRRKRPSDQFALTENTKTSAVDLNDKLRTSNKLEVELP